MTSIWTKYVLPMITTVLFSIFSILLALILIQFSRFLRRELKRLIDRYGRENVVKISLQGNIKGLVDLFLLRRKETTPE
ncbi:MAG: hypothetical protein HWN65_15125 [Candidatus Helarchaeota archaeon]|nr:hypothetical protein [Candidatus Helarchaeota archaeon]